MISSSRSLTIRFRSDDTINGKGFSISFWLVPPDTQPVTDSLSPYIEETITDLDIPIPKQKYTKKSIFEYETYSFYDSTDMSWFFLSFY